MAELKGLKQSASEGDYREALKQSNCVFDRLFLLASLRTPPHFQYRSRLGPGDDNDATPQAAMARLHLEVFWEWLALGLEEQTRQIEQRLSALASSELMALARLYAAATSGAFVPPEAAPHERKLFLSNMDLATGLLLDRAVHRFRQA